jgi:hypothetical protein
VKCLVERGQQEWSHGTSAGVVQQRRPMYPLNNLVLTRCKSIWCTLYSALAQIVWLITRLSQCFGLDLEYTYVWNIDWYSSILWYLKNEYKLKNILSFKSICLNLIKIVPKMSNVGLLNKKISKTSNICHLNKMVFISQVFIFIEYFRQFTK